MCNGKRPDGAVRCHRCRRRRVRRGRRLDPDGAALGRVAAWRPRLRSVPQAAAAARKRAGASARAEAATPRRHPEGGAGARRQWQPHPRGHREPPALEAADDRVRRSGRRVRRWLRALASSGQDSPGRFALFVVHRRPHLRPVARACNAHSADGRQVHGHAADGERHRQARLAANHGGARAALRARREQGEQGRAQHRRLRRRHRGGDLRMQARRL
mmetsp:Transcript_54040/g.117841  ORF Transcript_54040/g.117841 Transcript_54040/m.117841 type:complete len:216 (-) Transcript_54040:104-751(-)